MKILTPAPYNIYRRDDPIKWLLPDEDDIPTEYKEIKYEDFLLLNSFYCQLSKFKMIPRDGIDKDKAYRHITFIMNDRRIDGKIRNAAALYLLHLWYEFPDGEK